MKKIIILSALLAITFTGAVVPCLAKSDPNSGKSVPAFSLQERFANVINIIRANYGVEQQVGDYDVIDTALDKHGETDLIKVKKNSTDLYTWIIARKDSQIRCKYNIIVFKYGEEREIKLALFDYEELKKIIVQKHPAEAADPNKPIEKYSVSWQNELRMLLVRGLKGADGYYVDSIGDNEDIYLSNLRENLPKYRGFINASKANNVVPDIQLKMLKGGVIAGRINENGESLPFTVIAKLVWEEPFKKARPNFR
ncbi:MAG: hypothetical protein NTW04_00400 [Elusimicrobia bacterium]|nr:hypothetical protein [Elusimicrobiota bacterium]